MIHSQIKHEFSLAAEQLSLDKTLKIRHSLQGLFSRVILTGIYNRTYRGRKTGISQGEIVLQFKPLLIFIH